jgi:hypothetical protein
MEVHGFESHDSRLAVNAISEAFWLNNSLTVCRTGNKLDLPANQSATKLEGTGLVWYDTAQSHILTNLKFRNCGLRSDQYNQYDKSLTRGCSDDNNSSGCSSESAVFSFLTNSDQFVPEVMQATKQVSFENCGRRFKFTGGLLDTASGRNQNWFDTDGTVSGLGVPTLIGSGLSSARDWFGVDDEGMSNAYRNS